MMYGILLPRCSAFVHASYDLRLTFLAYSRHLVLQVHALPPEVRRARELERHPVRG